MKTKLSRRALLSRSLQIPMGAAALAALASCGRGASGDAASAGGSSVKTTSNVCADVEAMDENARSLRQSLHYTEMSPDQNTVCGGCSFFHAGGGGCGTCDMFTGGPANSHGHCDSWSKRSA